MPVWVRQEVAQMLAEGRDATGVVQKWWIGEGKTQAQGQGQACPLQQHRDDDDDREGRGVLTQKLAAIEL